MRFPHAALLAACLWMLPLILGGGGAVALKPLDRLSSAPEAHAVLEAKFVCGMTDDGFKCRQESGAIRRGKAPKIPGSPSSESSGGLTDGGDEDALPTAPGDTGAAVQSPPAAAPKTCPKNSELLAGYCIPYTQTCRSGLAASANPQPCQGAEEKQVCNFRADGLKDCCCRTYAKY